MASKSPVPAAEDRLSHTLAHYIPNRTRTDFLRLVSPSKKTLGSLEAKLISGVLDDCIHQLEIVSLLPTLLICPEKFSLDLGEELARALKEHHTLGERHQAITLDKSLDGSKLRKQQAESIKSVQDSFRDILRHLRKCLTTKEILKDVEPNIEEETVSQKLRDGLCELKEVVLERLLTTSAEEQERSQVMQEVSLHHHVILELIDSLDKEVSMAIKDRDTEISMLTCTINQLKSSLDKTEKGLEEFVVRTQQEAEKQNKSDKKTSEGKRAHVQQEVDQMRAQLNAVIAQYMERERELRKKKYKEESEIETLIQKYDSEMGEKQAELDEVTQRYEEEKAELGELEEHAAVLELEYTQIMEERQQAQKKREQQERERELHSQAAVVIQAAWRGFCVRKAMKAKAKPKKGKKGKGKKGK
ncbi:IQ domain-containing protein D [Triplophysa tibetana]|uniref:Dynein regulatory complex protein 10 n=1 Tax=Triplophysa tibetana TaxID=1572043 RepID=A0A5A9P637_9TELE|nr:IQ domain-containing protein D [Triplophysa tibetana]